MKIGLNFFEQFGDIELEYSDANGSHSLLIGMDRECDGEPYEIEITGDVLSIAVKPTKLDLGSIKEEISGVAEKLLVKFADKFASVANDMILHVGCRYLVNNLCDGDILDITCRQYSVSTDNQMFIFDLYPVTYLFYEISKKQKRVEPLKVWTVNRDRVLKSARVMALADFGLHLIITYPFQVGRVKRLTRDKKVAKKLRAFNAMSEEKRNKILEKS